MVKFETPWNYITRDFKNTLKQSFLAFVSLLIPIIGWLAILGWELEILEYAIKKKKKIPGIFEEFGKYFSEGVKYFLFLLIILLLFVVILFFPFIGVFYNSDLIFLSLFIFIPLIFILIVLMNLIIPILKCRYVEKREFSAFFNYKKAWKIMTKNFWDYIFAIIIIIVYGWGISICMTIISSTIIGLVSVMFFTGISILVRNKIIGTWYAETK